MGCLRPATPGFLATLTATILLAIVTFGVPWIKSVYFLSGTVQDLDGTITLGTLGYCLTQSNGTTCSSPSIGYTLDINALLDNNSSIQIPNVVVKWITYCLVLHIVALVLAAGSAVFGLLAHIREMSMTYCSTCISGFAAAVAMLAFIFDIALFFLTKARIDDIQGGSATIGNAIWLTLAGWVLLFFSGILYCCGRCCLNKRPRGPRDKKQDNYFPEQNQYAEQVQLDAIKAEADRKARQKMATEGGLPAFQEYQPLNRKDSSESYYEDGNHIVGGRANLHQNVGPSGQTDPNAGGTYAGGYAPAPPGTRTVDNYYNPPQPAVASYPPQPQPQRQGSMHTMSASSYSAYSSAPSPAPAVPQVPSQYLAAGALAAGNPHDRRDTSYYSHQQLPTSQSQYPDRYGAETAYGSTPHNNAAYNNPGYNNTGYDNSGYSSNGYADNGYNSAAAAVAPDQTSYYNPHSVPPRQLSPRQQQQDRSYTLGGGGYGANVVPEPLSDPYSGYTQRHHSPSPPAPLRTGLHVVNGGLGVPLSPTDPRQQQQFVSSPIEEEEPYEDRPPTYDEHTARPAGVWSTKS